MEDKHFEEKMKLLNKSYDRVPSQFNVDDVLSKIEAEGKPKKEVKSFTTPVGSKWQKVSVWAVSLASVLLIVFLSASFINEGKNQGSGTNSESKLEDIDQPEEVVLNKYGTGLHSQTINWPNSEVQQKVHGYFKSSDQAHGVIKSLINVSPVEIIVLYDYAQQKYFPDINSALLSQYEGSEQDRDQIYSDWLQRVIITEQVTSIRYLDELTVEKNGMYYGSVDIMNEERLIHSIPMVLEANGVWKIDTNSISPKYIEPLTIIDAETTNLIQDLYSRFKSEYDYSILQEESALVIAGIYLEAWTQGDLETQYELLVKGENYITPPREEFLSYPTGDGLDWKKQFNSFELNQTEATDVNGEFDGVAWFGLHDEFVTEDESKKGFQMRKTLDGWRVHFMPFQ